MLAIGGLSGVGYVQAEGKKVADFERSNVMRLSALQDLADLKRQADGLWPPLSIFRAGASRLVRGWSGPPALRLAVFGASR